MTMIPPFSLPPGRATNATPFSYRDGVTYLERLEYIARHINKTLIPEIEAFTGDVSLRVAESVNELIVLINASIAEITGNSITVQDPVVAGIVNNANSQLRTALDALYSTKTVQTLVESGYLKQTNLNAAYASKETETAVSTGRLSSETIDARFAEKASALDLASGLSNASINLTNGLAQKRDLTPTSQTANADFNTLVNAGIYVFSAAPTNTTAPANKSGFLSVEKSGTLVVQTYTAYANASSDPETFTRFIDGTSRSLWVRNRTNNGFVPRGKIAFIGDSYMFGLGLSSPSTERWPALLAASFGATEQNLANSGSGYTNSGSSGKFAIQAQSVSGDVNTVYVCGGINDAPLAPSQATINSEITAIVNNVRANTPNARIVFISPMWFQNNPSQELMDVADKIRAGVALFNLPYIEDAMWLRVDRAELAQGDGHPNAAGSIAIKNWVYDNTIQKPTSGPTRGKFVRSASSDAQFTGPTTAMLAEGTIRNARRGWYRVYGQALLYNVTLGFIALRAGNYTDEVRADTTNNVYPYATEMDYYHAGGDLYIGVGYRPNGSGSTSVQGNQKTRVMAEWISI